MRTSANSGLSREEIIRMKNHPPKRKPLHQLYRVGDGGEVVGGLRRRRRRERVRGEGATYGRRTCVFPKRGGWRMGGRRTRYRTLLPGRRRVRPYAVVRPRGARPPPPRACYAYTARTHTASAPCRRRSESSAARTHTAVVRVVRTYVYASSQTSPPPPYAILTDRG